jgi:hypothetical protein
MKEHHRWQRFAWWAAVLGLVGWLLAGPGPANSVPGPGTASAAEGQSGKHPSQILILRHAEKPKPADSPHLTSRGAARAAALPSLFLVPPTFPTKPAPFATPDFIFATEESMKSSRPVETVRPLAKALGDMHIHAKHKNVDFQAMVDEIFGDPKYAGKTILICWHHGKIPGLTLAILEKAKSEDQVRDQVPKGWGDTVFDRVWQLTFDDKGKPRFADRPQRLLFEDSAR